MTPTHCFAPVEDADATVLILGSMPGKASLYMGQYYAHPRNRFWRIMGEITGASPALSYSKRIRILRTAGIALWDVLASCVRVTSMDSDIEPDSIVPNDFVSFFSNHPNIRQVYFNGAKAEACYRKYVLPDVQEHFLTYQRLPSTSPANASMPYKQSLTAWKTILQDSKVGF